MSNILIINPNTTSISTFLRFCRNSVKAWHALIHRYVLGRRDLAQPIFLANPVMPLLVTRYGKFAIVTSGVRWKPMLERLTQSLGLTSSLARLDDVKPWSGLH